MGLQWLYNQRVSTENIDKVLPVSYRVSFRVETQACRVESTEIRILRSTSGGGSWRVDPNELPVKSLWKHTATNRVWRIIRAREASITTAAWLVEKYFEIRVYNNMFIYALYVTMKNVRHKKKTHNRIAWNPV